MLNMSDRHGTVNYGTVCGTVKFHVYNEYLCSEKYLDILIYDMTGQLHIDLYQLLCYITGYILILL